MISSSRPLVVAAMGAGSCLRGRVARHLAIALSLALAGCAAAGGDDRPERDATLMLDGPRAGVHAGIASAVARGYDEAEGVNLKLLDGRATPRTLTTGRATFAVLDLNELAGRRDVVPVMAIVQRPLLTFTTRARGLKTSWARRLDRPVRRWDLAAPTRETKVEDAGVPLYPERVLAVARATLEDSPSVVRATV